MNRALGYAEGSIRFNGHEWQVVKGGYWERIVYPVARNYEIEVEFHD